jgi:hypothetical protein
MTALLAEGRFTEALAARERLDRAERESGVATVNVDRSARLEVTLDAALGALRRRGLSSGERRRLRRSAEWLARRGVFDYPCLGHRALALLDHDEHRPRDAARALRRALSLSSANARPRHRWLCLEAARDLGALTLDQEAEAGELAAAGRFALPVGWADEGSNPPHDDTWLDGSGRGPADMGAARIR